MKGIDTTLDGINATPEQGGQGGTSDYNQLSHKPRINGREIEGDFPAEAYGLVSFLRQVTKFKEREAARFNIDAPYLHVHGDKTVMTLDAKGLDSYEEPDTRSFTIRLEEGRALGIYFSGRGYENKIVVPTLDYAFIDKVTLKKTGPMTIPSATSFKTPPFEAVFGLDSVHVSEGWKIVGCSLFEAKDGQGNRVYPFVVQSFTMEGGSKVKVCFYSPYPEEEVGAEMLSVQATIARFPVQTGE